MGVIITREKEKRKKGVEKMKIVGTPKEIADFIQQLQSQQSLKVGSVSNVSGCAIADANLFREGTTKADGFAG